MSKFALIAKFHKYTAIRFYANPAQAINDLRDCLGKVDGMDMTVRLLGEGKCWFSHNHGEAVESRLTQIIESGSMVRPINKVDREFYKLCVNNDNTRRKVTYRVTLPEGWEDPN